MLRILHRSGVGDPDFYDAAVRCIQLATAIAMHAERAPATIDATEACASRALDAETAARVQSLFNKHAELHYAGISSRPSQALSPERRAEVLQTIERFEHAKANV